LRKYESNSAVVRLDDAGGHRKELRSGIRIGTTTEIAGSTPGRRRCHLRQERRVPDHQVEPVIRPVARERILAVYAGSRNALTSLDDGERVNVDPDQFTPGPERLDALGDRPKKPSVAARRVENTHRSLSHAVEESSAHDRIDDPLNQIGRRVPRSELLTVSAGCLDASARTRHIGHDPRLRARRLRQVRRSARATYSRRVTERSTSPDEPDSAGRYLTFHREMWAALRASTPLTLGEPELAKLQGINEQIDTDEVTAIYLPLSRLLNLYVSATQDLHKVSATFLGAIPPKVPYVIGVAGSVAVGKSTFARILEALLAQWPDHPKVDLITTDGFLYPNRVLEERGLMNRKGFPESYDTRELLRVLREIKSGREHVEAPVYSHVVYDIIEGERVVVSQPDIVILEGLNVLQTGSEATEFVSDYFDFSIYLDATEHDIEAWYVERFLALRQSVFQDPDSFFRFYADLSDEEAVETALGIWRGINGLNLRENIAPTRDRASLVIHKQADHRVDEVRLRRL
jgi:type I pantothenate kinase